jgi:predicted acylesterase/phospholipase RssA
MRTPKESHFALVLPGAVAKGAFEAGVISILADQESKIDRIVATSSGALNGLAYAAGIRSGNEKEMAKRLVDYWIDNGEWNNSLSFNPLNWFKASGLSNQDGLLKMMRELIKPCELSQKKDVEFRIIVSPLHGIMGKIGQTPATSYEKVLEFKGEDFDTQEGLERMFTAVTAACAFPGLFTPVDVEGLGPCVDGGAVNNAPINYALKESGVDRVIMPIPFPAVMPPAKSLKGLGLLNHLIEILINERLYRDLTVADTINRHVDHLEGLVKAGKITEDQMYLVTDTLHIRKVQITEIRPVEPIKQSAFSGFFKKEDRIRLVEAGQNSTRHIFATLESPKN